MSDMKAFGSLVLLGSRDVCDLLSISRGYLMSLAEQNKLPNQKTSSGYIFEKESVLAFQRKRIEKSKIDPRIKL